MRRALVIGKFYPPHLGHKFLIDVASTNSDQVDVLVCERLDQTIPGSLRVKWIREMCPKVNVWQVEDIYDDDNSERWAMYVRSLLGRTPEVVFSSEAYGERFALFSDVNMFWSIRPGMPCQYRALWFVSIRCDIGSIWRLAFVPITRRGFAFLARSLQERRRWRRH